MKMTSRFNSTKWSLLRRLVLCSLCISSCVAHRIRSTKEEIAAEETSTKDHRFFLQQIFDKYGHRGVMTFEGFEHLLENLGLGRLKFDKSHTVSFHKVNGTFKEVHDKLALHQHDHGENQINESTQATTTSRLISTTHVSTTSTPTTTRSPERRYRKKKARRKQKRDVQVTEHDGKYLKWLNYLSRI